MSACARGLVVVLLAACGTSGRATPSTPAASASAVPASEPVASPPAIAQASCAPCVLDGVSWWRHGGMSRYSVRSSVGPCSHYAYRRETIRGEPAPPATCAMELAPGCDTGATTGVGALQAALSRPEVVAALAAGGPALYGHDSRPYDGSVLRISVASKTVDVGSDCGTQTDVPPDGCRRVPPDLRALASMLSALDEQAAATPSCATALNP